MFKDITVKNTTVCSCGREFIIQDIQKLENIDDRSFFAGVVRHYSKAICSKCGKEVILLLRQAGQTYEVVSIAEENKIVDVKKDKEIIPNEKTIVAVEENTTTKVLQNNEEINENIIDKTTIAVDEKNISSNELICPDCGREFRNKAGLTNHMKTHQK